MTVSLPASRIRAGRRAAPPRAASRCPMVRRPGRRRVTSFGRRGSREPERHGLWAAEQDLLAGFDEPLEVLGHPADVRYVQLALVVAPLALPVRKRHLVQLVPRIVVVDDVAGLEPGDPVLDLADPKRVVLLG